jgi:hypothetical protein
MNIFLAKAGAAAPSARAGSKSAGVILGRFGNDVVVALPPARSAGEIPAAARQLAVTDPGRLHVVVQEGREFILDHPDVPVLLNRGRHLLVDLAPGRAAELTDDACYGILPAGVPITVFEEPSLRAPRDAVPDWESALVAAVDAAAFRADIDALCAFPNRHSLGEGLTAATAMAMAKLDALGLDTHTQAIDIKDGATPVGSSTNLIAFKAGIGPTPRGLVLVTAHLDSINKLGRFDPSLPAPGADDNGSGSAGVLQMASIFAPHPALEDMMFILFGGEEEGLFGSTQFVAGLPASDRARLRAVVNMDMIGVVNAPPQSVLLEGAPVSRHIIDGLAERAAAHTRLLVRTSLHPYNSDHVPFIDAGLPAVLVIEGDDEQNKTIHSPADTKDKLTDAFAAEILRMNVGYVASLVGRALPA